MAKLELTAKVYKVFPSEEGISKAGKAWRKQRIVVDIEDERFPHKLAITLTNSSLVDKINPNQVAKFTCSVESREWSERWYTDVNCYYMEKINQDEPESVINPELRHDEDNLPF